MDAQIKWLGRYPFNYTVTLHYHQTRINTFGREIWISRETGDHTTNRFMHKLDRLVLGPRAQKNGCYLNRVAFHEIDPKNGRLHTHLALELPENISDDDLKRIIDCSAKSLFWIDRRVFMKAIEPGTQVYFVAYCHKDGMGSFSLDASRLRPL